MEENRLRLYRHDSRFLDKIITEKIINVTITSPPYYNLKDYGSPDQIGFGQTYKTYLEDLKLVFSKVYNITKDDGTLWVIIDTFRENHEVVPLPFDFSNKLKEVGWKLKDIIIWSKDRTVPWVHKGKMRNLYEYILVFSKTEKFKFYINRIRDNENLKKWWITYPERYNPKGKVPEEIWNFDIPTQGAWGKGYIKHFCPLPEELVQRIIKLSTNENDVVFDPFAGSGTVLAQAKFMNRKFLGFELNEDYINMFHNYVETNFEKKIEEYNKAKKNNITNIAFQKTIIELRIIKYAKMLLRSIGAHVEHIYVEKLDKEPRNKFKITCANYCILLKEGKQKQIDLLMLDKLATEKSLRQFSIEATFRLFTDKGKFVKEFPKGKIYGYKMENTHRYTSVYSKISSTINEPILSTIKKNIDEKKY